MRNNNSSVNNKNVSYFSTNTDRMARNRKRNRNQRRRWKRIRTVTQKRSSSSNSSRNLQRRTGSASRPRRRKCNRCSRSRTEWRRRITMRNERGELLILLFGAYCDWTIKVRKQKVTNIFGDFYLFKFRERVRSRVGGLKPILDHGQGLWDGGLKWRGHVLRDGQLHLIWERQFFFCYSVEFIVQPKYIHFIINIGRSSPGEIRERSFFSWSRWFCYDLQRPPRSVWCRRSRSWSVLCTAINNLK